MSPLLIRKMAYPLLLVLAVEISCLHAQGFSALFDENLVTDTASCTNTSDAMSLLQVGVHSLSASNNDGSKTMPSTAELFIKDSGENEEDKLAIKQLEDVTLGILGSALMIVDKSDTETGVNHLKDWTTFISEDQHSLHLNKNHLTWVFGSYHKTGCELSLGICEELSGKKISETLAQRVTKKERDGKDPTKPFNQGENWYFAPELSVITQLPNYRFVHMIRDPSAMIVSSYHWHWQDASNEYWLSHPMHSQFCYTNRGPINNCKTHYSIMGLLPEIMYNPSTFNSLVQPEHHDVLIRFNASVQNGETLHHFYRSVSNHDGVIIEAYRVMWTLNLMTRNYLNTRKDDRTVQIRMERVTDAFPSTMRCMLSFLQKSHHFDVEWAMRKLDKLDVSKYGGAASAAPGGSKHISDMSENEKKMLHGVLDSVHFVQDRAQKLSLPANNDC